MAKEPTYFERLAGDSFRKMATGGDDQEQQKLLDWRLGGVFVATLGAKWWYEQSEAFRAYPLETYQTYQKVRGLLEDFPDEQLSTESSVIECARIINKYLKENFDAEYTMPPPSRKKSVSNSRCVSLSTCAG